MSWAMLALCWSGWALALAAVWTLRRRMARLAEAEHELRGAATAIGLAAKGESVPLVRLELDRMGAALADLAEARGARPAPAADLEAGRLAQVLANVVANAAEHGIGPVEVRVSNLDRPRAAGEGTSAGRGRGLPIARRAARELGGRLTIEREGGRTKAVLRLPSISGADESASRDGSPGEGAAPDGASRDGRRRAA